MARTKSTHGKKSQHNKSLSDDEAREDDSPDSSNANSNGGDSGSESDRQGERTREDGDALGTYVDAPMLYEAFFKFKKVLVPFKDSKNVSLLFYF